MRRLHADREELLDREVVEVAGDTAALIIHLDGVAGGPAQRDGDQGRDRIEVLDRRGALAVVNVVPLEVLLYGLVPAEIFARAHPEALKAQAVTNVPGIVTGVRATGRTKGFWIQQPTKDPAKANASTGVFVFTASNLVVAQTSLSDTAFWLTAATGWACWAIAALGLAIAQQRRTHRQEAGQLSF